MTRPQRYNLTTWTSHGRGGRGERGLGSYAETSTLDLLDLSLSLIVRLQGILSHLRQRRANADREISGPGETLPEMGAGENGQRAAERERYAARQQSLFDEEGSQMAPEAPQKEEPPWLEGLSDAPESHGCHLRWVT